MFLKDILHKKKPSEKPDLRLALTQSFRIDNGGLALISLRLTFFFDSFMTTWSILKHNTSNKSRDCKLLKDINDILLHTRMNGISK